MGWCRRVPPPRRSKTAPTPQISKVVPTRAGVFQCSRPRQPCRPAFPARAGCPLLAIRAWRPWSNPQREYVFRGRMDGAGSCPVAGCSAMALQPVPCRCRGPAPGRQGDGQLAAHGWAMRNAHRWSLSSSLANQRSRTAAPRPARRRPRRCWSKGYRPRRSASSGGSTAGQCPPAASSPRHRRTRPARLHGSPRRRCSANRRSNSAPPWVAGRRCGSILVSQRRPQRARRRPPA